jgi:hypothetical protein
LKYKPTIRIVLFLVFLGGNGITHAQSDEYWTKAGFLERFTGFIDWPQGVFQTENPKAFIISLIARTRLMKS